VFTERYGLNLKMQIRLILDFRVRSHVSLCGIFGGRNGTGTGLTPSTSALPCQYVSTNAPYSLYTRCFYQDNWAKRWNLPKSSAFLVNKENWIEEYVHLVFKRLNRDQFRNTFPIYCNTQF
jgi:hypothetical protein